MAKAPPPFHNPFAAAKQKLAAVVKPAPPEKKEIDRASGGPRGLREADRKGASPPADEPGRAFLDEMAGVAKLRPDPRGRVRAPAPPSPPSPSRRAIDEAEAYAELADLIEGSGSFDFSDTDEFIEGIAPGLDRRILRQLKRGDYALQGHVDLHGMTREEARVAVERFVTESRANGRRCVLIVHGRGLNSKDQIPVLKERVRAWLERGRLARSVLAFCTARPSDGGAGAVYVLLRR